MSGRLKEIGDKLPSKARSFARSFSKCYIKDRGCDGEPSSRHLAEWPLTMRAAGRLTGDRLAWSRVALARTPNVCGASLLS
jgi:hypothetical protein